MNAEQLGNIKLYNADCIEFIQTMGDESVDVILTDPPYLYLKNQKLDVPFDEQVLFSECKRVLKKDGFIVMFGRGTSFYRWNTILDNLGFTFKEEIIWDKSYSTSPLMRLSRVHETVSIHTKGNGTINKVKVPYLEMKSHDIGSIIQDMKRVRTVLKNTKSLNAVLDFLKNNQVSVSDNNGMNERTIIRTDYCEPNKPRKGITAEPLEPTGDRCVNAMQSICFGLNEKSIIRSDREDCDTFTKFGVNTDKRKIGDRATNVVQSIEFGMNEKSIIKEVGNRYKAIHPTEKPIRLLERLLALVVPKDIEQPVIFDPFGGSFSTMEAVYNMNLKGISCEIDKEFFEAGKKRVDSLIQQPKLF